MFFEKFARANLRARKWSKIFVRARKSKRSRGGTSFADLSKRGKTTALNHPAFG